MHPTPTRPGLGPITVTGQHLAQMRDLLQAKVNADLFAERHSYTYGWLTGTIQLLTRHVTDPDGRELLAEALALIALVQHLDQADGFTNPSRDDPPTGQALPKGVDGFGCGRYAR